MLVDFHAHIDLYKSPNHIIQRCNRASIYVLAVTTTPKAWVGTNNLISTSSKIKAALGFHPEIAKERIKDLELFEHLIPMAKYIGEVGVDGRFDAENIKVQINAFKHIIDKVNKAGGRIMSIHSRQATTLTLDILQKSCGQHVLHWFSGSKTELDRAIDMGCWFSVGVQMFTNKRGRDIISAMPKNRILTETDGPFVQNGKKPIEPLDVSNIFPQLSDIWGMDTQDVEAKIAENFLNLVRSVNN